jgi:putative transposase
MKTIEFKLYLKPAQEETLSSWMRTCCGIFNRALDQRIKAYERRAGSVNYNQQQALLTQQRARMVGLASIPVAFERDALRRVDRGLQAFFRRAKAGAGKVGFPRFRSWKRYNSMEYAAVGQYVRGDSLVSIPKLGLVRIRCGNQRISKTQKLLRIIRRASGWYGQVVVTESTTIKNLEDQGSVGIDVGLESFATLSDGSQIENPRFYRKSEKKLRGLQRSVSRKKKGSQNRRKAVVRLQRQHERIAAQRRSFCHRRSTELVRGFSFIAAEKLNIKGMVKNHCLAKSISDASWGIFMNQISVKAANAARVFVQVDPRGTSQECPDCGVVKKKELSEREHNCSCGSQCHRDHASARVVLARALVSIGVIRLSRDSAAEVSPIAIHQADPLKKEDALLSAR